MAVPPGLYNTVQGKSVSEAIIWECFQWRFEVLRRVDSPRGYFQWVLVSARQAMSISFRHFDEVVMRVFNVRMAILYRVSFC